ncbi:tetratricopeptide repeat protein [Dechloromonas sp. A34]|uniref:tetratricopeptide repeat protein n=1 Tax=Dechloromonas sp. A34 TaxID=447588 RepID=UPI0022496123|nr:tetratricopeptide repeat protein [Dechloromonas sp. A34]
MFSSLKKIFLKKEKPEHQEKEKGDRYLSEGNLEAAERCYKEALKQDPGYCDALINIAYILTEKNKNSDAIAFLDKARAISAKNQDIYFFLGLAHKNIGNTNSAIENFRLAIQYKPDFDAAYLEICQCLVVENKLDEAKIQAIAATKACQENNDIHHLLGNILASRGELEDAIGAYIRSIELQPNAPEVHIHLATAYRLRKDDEAAIEHYRLASQLQPQNAEPHANLGDLLLKSGKFALAHESYQKAIAINPQAPSALSGIALLLQKKGKLESAVEYYEKALAIAPKSATIHCHFGIALQAQNKLSEAVAAYRRALAINPEYAEAHNNLAGALHDQNNLTAVIEHLQKAITIDPGYAEAHSNLGVALYEQGHVEQSVASFYRALTVNPEHIAAHSSLLFVLSFSQQHSPEEYLVEARRFGEKISRLAKPFTCHPPVTTTGKIKVGLVSGDLRGHPVGYFLENILHHINPERIELTAYPTNDQVDALTRRIKPYFKSWKPITWLNDESAARMIYNDGMDILVDLAGHSAHNRLPVFAWKPAPIQASWLGFFASTGLSEIDYILVDPSSVPPDGHAHYSETPCFLPETRLCFTPPAAIEAPEIASLPARQNGHITFGCFQHLAKLNDQVLKLWGRIAQAIPDARFRLQIKQLTCDSIRIQFQQRLSDFGIPAERTMLFGPQNREGYLAAHSNIDIILDTFPYPGGTTTCEALWMGVPTLTLSGNSMLARQGASIMSCTGLADWIATDEDDYLDKAIKFAGNLEDLSDLRASLRTQAGASPLFDAPRFARALESKLTEMHQEKTRQSRHADG